MSVSVSEALATHVDEIIGSMELAPHNGFHLEPRCRVCRNDLLRKKVNTAQEALNKLKGDPTKGMK